MARGSEIKITILGDSKSAERAFKRASQAGTSMGRSFAHTGKLAAVGLAGLATGAVLAGSKMVKMASDAEEVRSKMTVVFGKQLPALNKRLDEFADKTGASSYKLREQAADMGALLGPILGTRKAAAGMSSQFVQLATDLGSFNNVPVDDALVAIRAGLVGESEPLRRFGVLLNAAAVQSEGLRLGLIKQGEQMTEQQKVQARASLIMQQTTQAQGDAERTAGSMSNQMKALSNNINDAATTLGIKLIPYALSAVRAFNDNWPTIERISGRVLGAVIQGIEWAIQVIRKAIDWYRQIASAAERYWPQVQQAAAKVVAWYRGTLAPAIENVLTAIRKAWEIFGPAITRVATAAFNQIKTVVTTAMKIIGGTVEAVLALIRGDWSEAWNKLKQVAKAALDGVVATIRNIGGLALDAAFAVGQAIVQGIAAGMDSLKDWLVQKAKGIAMAPVNAAKGILGVGSPSRVTADEIGRPFVQGIVRGMEAESPNLLRVAMKTSKDAAHAARQGILDAKADYGSAWGGYTSAALAAFDDMSSKIQTKSERLLDKMRATREKQAIKQGVSDARSGLAEARAGGDPDAILAAERALDDALYRQREYALEQKAALERRKQDEETASDRLRFEKWLATRSIQQQSMLLKEGAGQKAIVAKIKSYDEDYKAAGVRLGNALAQGLLDARGGVVDAANKLAAAINKALGVASQAGKSAADSTGGILRGKTEGRAVGGPVSRGVPYVVGEKGPEVFVPSTSGRIIPNGGMPASSGGRSAGSTVINVSLPNYLGSPAEVAQVIRRELITIGRNNAGNLFAGVA